VIAITPGVMLGSGRETCAFGGTDRRAVTDGLLLAGADEVVPDAVGK
jgi:hypothetical protein